jgi:hypothetical protein
MNFMLAAFGELLGFNYSATTPITKDYGYPKKDSYRGTQHNIALPCV